MPDAGTPSSDKKLAPRSDGRLTSWKEIAEYLGRDVRTAQRWEQTHQLPVHRLLHEKGSTVYALVEELDAWTARRSSRPQTVDPPVATLPRSVPFGWLVLAVASVIAVGGVGSVLRFRQTTPSYGMAVPLTSDSGFEWGPQLSPDGTRFSYTRGDQSLGPVVVVQSVTGGSSMEVAGPERTSFSPIWSPDGKSLALLRRKIGDPLRDSYGLTDLVILPATGGDERTLATIYTPGPFREHQPEPFIAWSPSGRFLVACDLVNGTEKYRLSSIDRNTGDKQFLTDGGAVGSGDYSPRFSPDGRRIAFTRVTGFGTSGIYVLSLTEDMRPQGQPQQLPSHTLWNASPVWTPTGRDLVFRSGTLRSSTLSVMAADGRGEPRPLPIADYGFGPFDLANTGPGKTRLLYTRIHLNEDIWKLPLPKNEQERPRVPPEPIRVVGSSYFDAYPRFSPDGDRFAWISNRGGDDQLWIAASDGTQPKQLTAMKNAQLGRPAWHPDGQRIVVSVLSRASPGIYEVPAAGGEPRLLLKGTSGEEHPAWSPDGRWLFFTSGRNGGVRVWKTSAQGGEPMLVASDNAHAPLITPDGKSLVYLNPATFLRPIDGGPAVRLFGGLYATDHLEVANKGVYATVTVGEGAEEHQALALYSTENHRIHQLHEFQKPISGGLSISRDGSYLLFSLREHQVIDIMMVDGLDAL